MKTLIAGFGNVLLGDDGFGVHVIKHLAAMTLPNHVQTMDVGIAGMELVLRLKIGFDEVIVIDAVRRGEAPGTLYVFAPSPADLSRDSNEALRPLGAGPVAAIRQATTLDVLPEAISLVGCEPENCSPGNGLGAAVRAAVEQSLSVSREL